MNKKIFTEDEVETVKWMVIVAEFKIKELQEDSEL